MKEEFKFTREWFLDKNNQVHTIQDTIFFGKPENTKDIIHIGEHFLLDLQGVYGNGKNRDSTDVEIWEVENTKKKYYCKGRGQWFNFKMIRKVTTGNQFGCPNGYWKVPEELNGMFSPEND